MSMFDNFQNLDPNYVPNNIDDRLIIEKSADTEIPRKEYNMKKQFIGYSWNYGDTFSMKFYASNRISVENNSIIYELPGEKPDTLTEGQYGQKAYNTYDKISWTCKTLGQTIYNWEQDKTFSYICGDKTITLHDNLQDTIQKTITLNIYNFRYELLDSFVINSETDEFTFTMTEELSKKYIPGNYFYELVSNTDDICRVYEKNSFLVK